MYRGKVGLDVAEAQHLIDGLDWQGAVKDIHASVNWLKANGSKKVHWLFILCLLKTCLKFRHFTVWTMTYLTEIGGNEYMKLIYI